MDPIVYYGRGYYITFDGIGYFPFYRLQQLSLKPESHSVHISNIH